MHEFAADTDVQPARAANGSTQLSTGAKASSPTQHSPASITAGASAVRLGQGIDAFTSRSMAGQSASASKLRLTQRPLVTTLTLITSDLLALFVANLAAVALRYTMGGLFDASAYWTLWPLLAVFIAAFALNRLYRFPLPAPEEISRVVTTTGMVYLGFGAITFMFQHTTNYSRGIYVMGFVGSIVAVLLGRTLTKLLAGQSWWGVPAVVVGCGRRGRGVIRFLLNQPELGLTPVGILDDRPWRKRGFKSVPVLGQTSRMIDLAKKHPHLRFIILCPELSALRMEQLFAHDQYHLPNLLLIPHLSSPRSVGVQAHDLNGTLGLELRHRLPDPIQRTLKRGLDLLLVILCSPLLLLIGAVIALAIKMDSTGPVFFKHQRIGRNGKAFMVWKFRSMVDNAHEVLNEHLTQNPQANGEWAAKQKLCHDPRITRVGAWLRKTSLDELPQLFNVLLGQMSLVGPRPIVQNEARRYGCHFPLYTRIRPGVTGMWQVSGRNDLSYDERVKLDEYYVRNWSVWLDISILIRTLLTVTLRRGAY